jgi:hypothetical protein
VELREIDPVYFEHSYYLAPDKGGQKAYALLRQAMEESQRVAIGRVVMRGREYLTAIRALHAEGSIVLASGLRVMLEAALWHPDPAVVQELATRFHLGLYGVDPRVMIDPGDIHAVVACFSDPEQQAEALDRAIAEPLKLPPPGWQLVPQLCVPRTRRAVDRRRAPR